MSGFRNRCLGAGLKALYASRAHRLLAPWTQGAGLIFMLHHVTPEPPGAFDPNRILRVTPEFLDQTLSQVRAAGIDIVSLDEAHRRLMDWDHERRFACFTLDDGYRDNRDFAYPIFKKHEAPFTIYVPTQFADGEGRLWWLALQEMIAKADEISVVLDDGREQLACGTAEEKSAAFEKIYWWLRAAELEDSKTLMAELAAAQEFDFEAHCRSLVMSWEELRSLNADPLVTIGAHTVGHDALTKLSAEALRADTQESIERIEAELGERPYHMSYPYGDAGSAGPREFDIMRTFGFKTAVTTRKGLVFPEHRDYLTALPRVSLNGDFQSADFLSLYLSGAPFALWNGFKHVNAA